MVAVVPGAPVTVAVAVVERTVRTVQLDVVPLGSLPPPHTVENTMRVRGPPFDFNFGFCRPLLAGRGL